MALLITLNPLPEYLIDDAEYRNNSGQLLDSTEKVAYIDVVSNDFFDDCRVVS
ncbi:MAG: hypothetical protein K8F52_05220 [Candidatus Scalindua rubra]|nr:hypothetical protein [Candidatus Scalindua rubra]